MNAPTEKERALANLRHLYQQMAGGQVKDSAQAKRIADGLLSPAIAKLEQAARRDPAVPVTPVTDAMREAAEEAYMPFGDMHLAIQAALAAAPQPPEVAQSNSAEFDGVKTKVAPVQLPEPVAKVEDGGLKWHIPDSGYSLPVRYLQGTHKLYTEQQVRELLANHGIQEQNT